MRNITLMGIVGSVLLLCLLLPDSHTGAPASLPFSATPPELATPAAVQTQTVVRQPAEEAATGWSVRVLALDKPLAACRVGSERAAEFEAVTDANGMASIPDSVSRAVVRARGFLPAVATRAENAVVEVQLQSGAQVSGRTIDQDGNPLAGVVVTLGIGGSLPTAMDSAFADATPACVHIQNDGNLSFGLMATSDAAGRWSLSGVPVGSHQISATKPGYLQADAAGPAEAAMLRIGTERKDREVKLRRAYVAHVQFGFVGPWPATNAMSLTRRVFKAPDGLAMVPEEALGAQREGWRTAVEQSGGAGFTCVTTANDGSQLGESVEAELTIDVWGQPRRSMAIRMVPLDRFGPGSTSVVQLELTSAPRTVVVTSPVLLSAMSIDPPGFGFDPVSVEGLNQVFLLPDGQHRLLPQIPLLLSKKRFHILDVRGDQVSPVSLREFDGVSFINLTAIDSDGNPPASGSFVITSLLKPRGDLTLPLQGAKELLLPCEAGSYRVAFRNQACAVVREAVVEVPPTDTFQCRLTIPIGY